MRSITIVFLTLLVFMSCTKIDSYDSVLLELSADPRSEAIFATIAIQMKQSQGFDRVIALLNTLVDDSRKQLHDTNKLFTAVDARCQVDSNRFADKLDYYTNRNNQLTLAIEAAAEAQTNAEATTKALNEDSATVSAFLTAAVSRHNEERTELENRINNAKSAVKDADDAIEAVNSWNVANKGASFVEMKLKKLTTSYLQVKSYHIIIPQSFIQMAASDDQVKTRLLEWLASLKVSLLQVETDLTTLLGERNNLFNQVEAAARNLVTAYTTEVELLKKEANIYQGSAEGLRTAQKDAASLRDTNRGLVDANKVYCSTERTNFNTAKTTLESQISLFKEIRSYFRNNYEKINQFVKDKYNNAPSLK